MIGDQRIIDFHGHTGRQDTYNMIDDPAAILHAMDRVGIDVACLFNIFHPDGTTGNDITARFVAAHPDRFVGFAYVSPTMPDGMVAEPDAGHRRAGHGRDQALPALYQVGLERANMASDLRVCERARAGDHLPHGHGPALGPRSAGGLCGPVSERKLRRRARGQRGRATRGGDQGGADLPERLPGDLLDISHAGRHRSSLWTRRARTGYCTAPTSR